MDNFAKFPIEYVSDRSGFTLNLIRTWEKRYDILKPDRTNTKRRLYTEEDIGNLLNVKAALAAGMKTFRVERFVSSPLPLGDPYEQLSRISFLLYQIH